MSSTPQGEGGPGPPQDPPPLTITPPLPKTPRPTNSYADRAKMNVRFDQRLKRNVLEIEVEKIDVRDEMFLSQEAIAKLLHTIGMDINTQVEGYQVNYGGKTGKIAVLCKTGVDLDRFCRQESFQVCKGIVTKNIRPAGRKDTTVTVSGLDFNTPDTLVQEYITKFGGVLVSQNVIYGRHGEGPFKGKVNGDRKYQVDFSAATTTMGSYHFLDGERVRVYYRSNTKTCGRCHQGGSQCPGGGIARECQNMGGQRKDLIEHMKELWHQIGFSPTSFKIPERESDDNDVVDDLHNLGGDQKILELANFPRQSACPILSTPEKEKFSKIRITNFPLEITVNDALEFMKQKVDKSIDIEDIEIVKDHRSSQIILGPGPDKSRLFKAQELLDFTKTQKYVYPDRRLYVRLHRPLTPEKPTQLQPNHIQAQDSVESKVMTVVNDLENKEDKKKKEKSLKLLATTSQAKLSGAKIPQVTKHKQGLASEKSYRN